MEISINPVVYQLMMIAAAAGGITIAAILIVPRMARWFDRIRWS
jgi:hypothetical protein